MKAMGKMNRWKRDGTYIYIYKEREKKKEKAWN